MLNELVDFIRYESEDIRRYFEKASLMGQGTPQEISDYREHYFNKFLERYFPFPHRITKGKIRDSYGKIAASIDSIVINPVHPYTIDQQGKFSLILADGVDLVVELKPDISTKSELIRGLEQISSVKRLRRKKGPIMIKDFVSETAYEYSKQIPSFLFSIKAKEDIRTIIAEIREYYTDRQTPIEDQFYFIVINDRGIIANYKIKDISIAIDLTTNERLTGYFFEEWKENTIAAFIVRMNTIYHAAPTMTGGIMTLYFDDFVPYNIVRL